MRIAIASNRHLDGVKRMRMPVSKRFEWDIARDERLLVLSRRRRWEIRLMSLM